MIALRAPGEQRVTAARLAKVAGLVLLALQVTWVRSAEAQLDLGTEYAAAGYNGEAARNPIAQLAVRLGSGDVQLELQPGRLYLDSLLDALDIDASSQVLVYSRTSLQGQLITAATPRAIYFNDTTYVAWIPGTKVLEIVTTDAALGPVFYTVGGRSENEPEFERHTGTCLICHDTYNVQGGGIPVLMAKSVLANVNGIPVGEMIDVTDTTPLEQRWGGWYVTGRDDTIDHHGNILFGGATAPADPKPLARNVESLDALGTFDTTQYLKPTSDIVALLILEHQVSVQNQITYVKFKAPAVLGRAGFPEAIGAQSWDELPPKAQAALARMLNRLSDSLLLGGAAPVGEIAGTSGFDAWFQSQGRRDTKGRSLRDLDLRTRLFKYPLSYLIYSAEFDALPPYAKDYVYRAIADALNGSNAVYSHITADEREAIHAILDETKPEFVSY